jgi:hypothetical protein
MKPIARRALLRILIRLGALGAPLALLRCSTTGTGAGSGTPAASGVGGMMGSGGMMGGGAGMMGAATSGDMSTYMDMFSQHTRIHRTVEEIPGGIRTTTESDDPSLASQIQAHVSAMYTHLEQGQEVMCMSPTLPTLFGNASGYHRRLTITSNGVSVTETSEDPHLEQMIREHAKEVTGFVQEGMPAKMRGMFPGT